MRALMISPAMPAMTGGGLSMRMGLFLHSLITIADTDLLVLPLGGLSNLNAKLDKRFVANCKIIPLIGQEDTQFKFISRIKDPVQKLEAFRNYGRSALTASLSVPVMAEINATTADITYDLIHVGRSYLADAGLVVQGHARRTLDADENDAEVSRRQAALAFSKGEQNWADMNWAEADACDRQQSQTLGKFDLVFASSMKEAESLQTCRKGQPISVVPNSALPPQSVLRQHDGNTLLFVGSLGHWPNTEGLQWFVHEVWPLVVASSRKQPRFLIVGRDCPAEIRELSSVPGISVHPDVENLDGFYAHASLAVVPLRAGGGTRIKIIEAALHGLPVVSTSLGAEGLPFANGREIWLADDAPSMAASIVSALGNPHLARVVGQRAQVLASSEFDFDRISRKLACQWTELLAKRIP